MLEDLSHEPTHLNIESSENTYTPEYDIVAPPWYIHGSFVMDMLTGEKKARDIDVFYPVIREDIGIKPPDIGIATSLYMHTIPMPQDVYFPPGLGDTYNTDFYLITPDGIVKPKGFPDKPTKLELMSDGHYLSLIDIIRGIKYSLRYNLPSDSTIESAWSAKLMELFTPDYMELMFFEDEEEVCAYIDDTLTEETADEEREQVKSIVSRLAGKVLT